MFENDRDLFDLQLELIYRCLCGSVDVPASFRHCMALRLKLREARAANPSRVASEWRWLTYFAWKSHFLAMSREYFWAKKPASPEYDRSIGDLLRAAAEKFAAGGVAAIPEIQRDMEARHGKIVKLTRPVHGRKFSALALKACDRALTSMRDARVSFGVLRDFLCADIEDVKRKAAEWDRVSVAGLSMDLGGLPAEFSRGLAELERSYESGARNPNSTRNGVLCLLSLWPDAAAHLFAALWVAQDLETVWTYQRSRESAERRRAALGGRAVVPVCRGCPDGRVAARNLDGGAGYHKVKLSLAHGGVACALPAAPPRLLRAIPPELARQILIGGVWLCGMSPLKFVDSSLNVIVCGAGAYDPLPAEPADIPDDEPATDASVCWYCSVPVEPTQDSLRVVYGNATSEAVFLCGRCTNALRWMRATEISAPKLRYYLRVGLPGTRLFVPPLSRLK